MNNDKELQNMFQRLADALPADPSLVDSVMRRLEQSPSIPAPPRKWNWIMRTTIAAAVCATAGIAVWLVPVFVLTPNVTLAQVQAAVVQQKWMHVKYDNGRERWTTMDGGKQYDKNTDGVITFHDWIDNIRLDYFPQLSYISRRPAYSSVGAPPGWKPRPWKPKTISEIVGFSMDTRKGEATAKQKEQIAYSERHSDTIDGRQLVRFDHYRKDALGHYLLRSQLWVDPETHLPVRARYLQQLGERKDPDEKYTIGEYDFSAQGPTSIYDLGVPRDRSIVDTNVKPPQDVAKVIELAREACDRFPTQYRLIVWPNGNRRYSRETEVIYRDGVPRRERGRHDWRGVRARQSHYFNMEEKYPAYHLPLPATAGQVLAWAQTQVPVTLHVSDGERTFEKHGPLPAPFYRPEDKVRPPRLEIRRSVSFNTTQWPTDYQWPFVDTSGPFAFLDDGAESIPGMIAIRTNKGNMRRDYHLDSNRDYICLHNVWWEKVAGQWAKEREYKLLDLKQLPGGQWYATKRRLITHPNPEREVGGYDITSNLDLRLLQENEFPPDIFNGEKVLEDAQREGAVIETY